MNLPWVIVIYMMITLAMGISALSKGAIYPGIAGIVGPTLSWFAASGLKGSLLAGTSPQKFAGLGAAVAFVAVGLGIVYDSGYRVGLWIATMRQHAEPRLKEISAAGVEEHIISKPDADMIFAFARADWERYVWQVGQPEGWIVRPLPLKSGTVLARFNQSTGMGASIQPLYPGHDQGPPDVVVVGRYYPVGFKRLSNEVIKKIEHDVRLELGTAYSVLANHAKMAGTNLEGFELIVTRERVDPRGSVGAGR